MNVTVAIEKRQGRFNYKILFHCERYSDSIKPVLPVSFMQETLNWTTASEHKSACVMVDSCVEISDINKAIDGFIEELQQNYDAAKKLVAVDRATTFIIK